MGDHIGIYPVPKDPFERLHGSFTTKKPFREVRRRAEELALEEITPEIVLSSIAMLFSAGLLALGGYIDLVPETNLSDKKKIE